MRKILFITAFKPSNISAGENFTRLLLHNLAHHNCINLVYFKYENETSFICSNDNIEVVREYSINKWVKLFTYLLRPIFFPVFRVRFNNARKKDILQLINVNNYDLVILDYGQCFEVGLSIQNRKILIAHDIFFQRYSRHNFFLGLWAKNTERKLLDQKNSEIFTFSNKDRQLIFDNYKLKSQVTGFFLDDIVLNAVPTSICNYFVFFARWSRKDNSEGLEWFFDNVYPFLNNNIHFKVIGAELDTKLASKIERANVEILGFVDNPYEIIANAKALIAPLFNGAGVKVKVIEALACGIPVIGSDVSFEGIDSDFSDFLIECKTSKHYVDEINCIDFSLLGRIKFKENFILRYNSNNILKCVN